jgi:hypothetical protein
MTEKGYYINADDIFIGDLRFILDAISTSLCASTCASVGEVVDEMILYVN